MSTMMEVGHQQLGASWTSTASNNEGQSSSSVEVVPAILEQYSDMLVNLVQSKIAAKQNAGNNE